MTQSKIASASNESSTTDVLFSTGNVLDVTTTLLVQEGGNDFAVRTSTGFKEQVDSPFMLPRGRFRGL